MNKTYEFGEDYLPKGGLPITRRGQRDDISGVMNGIILQNWLATGQVKPEELSPIQQYYAGILKEKPRE